MENLHISEIKDEDAILCNGIKRKVVKVHLSKIKAGDTIFHHEKVITVSNNNIKKDLFVGKTIFGDSYNLGYKLVTKIIF